MKTALHDRTPGLSAAIMYFAPMNDDGQDIVAREQSAQRERAQEDRKPGHGGGGQRRPKKISEKYLERSALHYLERYAASSDQLRTVMKRRIARSAAYHESSLEEAHDLLEQMILKLQQAGYLNDQLYAAAKARGRHRRGQSATAIASFLRTKGVSEDQIEVALAERGEDSADPELEAALTYCRKRRSGPYRKPDERAAYQQKDLAALARQGFSYSLARKVIEGDLLELEEEAKRPLP